MTDRDVGVGREAALDTPTNFASGPSLTQVHEARRGSWALRDAVGALMPDHRVAGCGRSVVPGRNATVVATNGRHTYGNIKKCGAVWLCPVCQHKIAAQRSAEVERAVASAQARGLVVFFMTLTVAHTRRDDLADLTIRQAAARRGMWSGRAAKARAERFGIVGSIANLEVTWGEGSGWHPHSHVLVFCRADAVEGFEDAMWDAWRAAATRQGFTVAAQGFDVQAVGAGLSAGEVARYVAKPSSSARRAWNVAAELAAGGKDAHAGRFTPFDLVASWQATLSGKFADLWNEYAGAFAGVGRGRGRRHLFWSRGLREALGLNEARKDEDVANDEGKGEVVGVLARDEWTFLQGAGLAGQFLEVCDHEGFAAALGVLRRWHAACA